MTPEQWEQADKIFEAVAALPREERPAFLDQACGEDEALRRKAQSLLDLEGRAIAFGTIVGKKIIGCGALPQKWELRIPTLIVSFTPGFSQVVAEPESA